jgi:cell division septum initiation protein DivIVA
MRVAPDDIDIELPRAVVGGLKVHPVEQLLRRVADDYALLSSENDALEKMIVDLQRAGAGAPASPPSVAQPAHYAPRTAMPARDPDEFARLLLSSAKQASTELRESARRVCESMLKKARARSLELERARATIEAELAALEVIRDEIRERMRSSLHAALELPTAR